MKQTKEQRRQARELVLNCRLYKMFLRHTARAYVLRAIKAGGNPSTVIRTAGAIATRAATDEVLRSLE